MRSGLFETNVEDTPVIREDDLAIIEAAGCGETGTRDDKLLRFDTAPSASTPQGFGCASR
jgi:hypothetical protein